MENVLDILKKCCVEYVCCSSNMRRVYKTDTASYTIDLKTLDVRHDFAEAEICFTGFLEKEKKELETMQRTANFRKVCSVTKNLRYLVCGSNPGPSKIANASKIGASVLSIGDFLKILIEG